MHRQRLGLVLVLCGGFAAPAPVALGATGAPRRFTSMVPMRDGLRLATDVHLPAGAGPWPAAFQRTPYGKQEIWGEPSTQEGPHQSGSRFITKGIAIVSQDMRGTGGSEGEWRLGVDDAWGKVQDGADTIAWIRRQPWCSGKVATFGMPIPQTLLAGAGPEGLVGQHVNFAPLSPYHHAFYQNGVFRPVWGRLVGDLKWPAEILQTWQQHDRYDDYWRGLDLGTRLKEVRWPMVFRSGWFQYFSQGSIEAFKAVQERGGPGARGRQHLVLGPWASEGFGRRKTGELAFPENAASPPGAPDELEWLLFWLKGEPRTPATEPAVRYYVMGDVDDPLAPGNTWRTAARWPPPSRPLRLYFRADGGLTAERPARISRREFDYDPARPVPTIGGAELGPAAGPRDQRATEGRPDVLVFSTPPLTQPLEVTGQIRVRLSAATSARDTDFTARLCDVYPDGRSILIADGIVRARYRRSLSRPEPVTPGQSYHYDIDLWSTSLVFNRGHRIRVAISSSNTPRFEPNPNTWPAAGSPPSVVAHQTVFLGGKVGSHIVLPEVSGDGKPLAVTITSARPGGAGAPWGRGQGVLGEALPTWVHNESGPH